VAERVGNAESELLRQGREAYEQGRWAAAHAALSQADETERLSGDELAMLATTIFMLGRETDSLACLERAHHRHLEEGETLAAVRSAFWVGMNLVLAGQLGPGTGWLGRAQRLLDHEEGESVERGYLLMALVFRHEAGGDLEAAITVGGNAVEIGERFGDRDLFALAVHQQGRLLIKQGRRAEGLALLDEAMVATTSGELSPIVTGIVYCSVILACQDVYEVQRAREWTLALSRWCEAQPDMLAFTGRCLVHRAEILQLNGSWPDALEEARRAVRRSLETGGRAAGLASYRQAELLRLQGELAAAEGAYREASRLGWEPQPGLAQLRLVQGRAEAAATSIRRAQAETTDPLKRAGLLPAAVEIMLAVGETEEARRACLELEEIAGRYESEMLAGMVAHARGAVELADGGAAAALSSLRLAADIWLSLEAPYETARTRALAGQACRALGDEEAGALELEAARTVFEQLGAAPDLERLAAAAHGAETHGLSRRELEVLRLVAAGKSNREIAASLVISEHTVARHLQNIFAKLRLSSRTEAAAFAFEHDLV